MKIIKEGISDRNIAMRVCCKGCEAELEINSNDVVKEDCRRYFTTCPCCKGLILIYEGQIPHTMLNRINYRET